MAGFHKLCDLKARTISKPGRHSNGGGLYLRVRNVNAKSWAFKWVSNGKSYEYGLGGYPAVTHAAARTRNGVSGQTGGRGRSADG